MAYEYWDREKVLKFASKFKESSDFRRNCDKAYQAAVRLEMLPEAMKHMTGRNR